MRADTSDRRRGRRGRQRDPKGADHRDNRGGLACRRRRNRRLRLATAGGLVAGYLLDAALGDPRRLHPVAGFGRAATALENRLYAPTRTAGGRFAAVAVGAPV